MPEKPHTWFGAPLWEIARKELVEIDEQDAIALVGEAALLLEHDFGFQKTRLAGAGGTPTAGGKIKWDWARLLAEGADDGCRNNAAAAVIGRLIWQYKNHDTVLEKALEWDGLNRPPLGAKVIRGKVKSLVEKDQRGNRGGHAP
jgi:hypothetical protein